MDRSREIIQQRLGRRPGTGRPWPLGNRPAADLVGQPDALSILRVGAIRPQAQKAETSLAGEERQDDRRVFRRELADKPWPFAGNGHVQG